MPTVARSERELARATGRIIRPGLRERKARPESGSACKWADRGYQRGIAVDYRDIITVEPGKRGGKPCIRGLRITVYEVLDYLAAGMTQEQVLKDFPYLTAADLQACLAYAADRERHLLAAGM